MAGTDDIEILRIALKEAEEEMCQLGHEMVNDGWDTATTSRTLDLLRIALYGSDGAGNGLEAFEATRTNLHELRVEEANS